MTNREPEPFLWIRTGTVVDLGRKLGMHLLGCYSEIMMRTAECNGEVSYDAAMQMLASIPEMDAVRARSSLDALISAEVIRRGGDALTIVAFGSSIVPDYDWEPEDPE